MGAKRGTGGASSATGNLTEREVGRFSLWLKGRGGQKAKKLALVSERGGDDVPRSFTEGGELSDGKNKILTDYREGKQRAGRLCSRLDT